jgi:hypothetical protein
MSRKLIEGYGIGDIPRGGQSVMGRKPSITLSGLVAYWKLNEVSDGSGAVSRQDSIGTNHLTDTNNTKSAAGIVYTNSAEFVRASTQRLTCASATALQWGNTDCEMCAWLYLPDETGQDIIHKSYDEFVLYSLTGNVAFYVGGHQASTTISTNTWTLITFGFNAATQKIFITKNGGAPISTSHPGGVPVAANTFGIGYTAGDGYFSGRANQVMFWKRLLTTTERLLLYGSGSGYPLVP